METAATYPEDLSQIINEGGYTKRQICNSGDTACYWRKRPPRTFIDEQESVPGCIATQDRLTASLGANIVGGLKLS